MVKDTGMQVNDNLADNFRGYAALLGKIKQRVLTAQQRAAYAANEEMLRMYWDIGEMLQQSQDSDGWGKKTLQRLAVDLKNDYAEIKGLTVRNMQYMVQFYNEYNQELTMVKEGTSPIAKPVVSQLGRESDTIVQSVIAQLGKYNFTLPSASQLDTQSYTFAAGQGHPCALLVYGSMHYIPLDKTLSAGSYQA